MTRLGQTSVQAAFSPDAALFAVVGTSNIRVFDTGNYFTPPPPLPFSHIHISGQGNRNLF